MPCLLYLKKLYGEIMNIVITGASRGIGFEVARLLAARGTNNTVNIVAIARNEQNLGALKNACIKENTKSRLYPIPFDLENSNGIEGLLVPSIKQHIENIDILINNAGLLINKTFSQLSTDEMLRMISVNFISAVNLTHALIPMMSKGGHVLNIGSMGGFQGSRKFKGLSIYSSSKAALASLTECLAEEYSESDISFNCLALGATDTEMFRQAFPGHKTPLTAAEMAKFIADFAVGGQKYFNGKILPVSSTLP